MKKLLLGLSAIALAVASLPMFAAFEAHVINVTARIENALTVDTRPIDYGTVFPQEALDRLVDLRLSDSFVAENRVDDITYEIRQKPKCGRPVPQSVPVAYDDFKPVVGETASGEFICPDGYVALPALCPYLSKHEQTTDGSGENDGQGLGAFHGGPVTNPWTLATTMATRVFGKLAKSEQDLADQWKIDLRVPCFAGECAQDWPTFVREESGNPQINPDDYVQPKEREHAIFGCDLWLEVNGVSLPGLGCKNADLMLVLDRSGSIEPGELTTLKTAAKAFVDALNPSTAGTHIGQSSFSDTGTLDLHLNDTADTIKAAIEALVSGGFTNLSEGISLATGELASHEHERDVVPDFLVIITDGNPNRPGSSEAEGKAAATAAAAAAKAAGIEIFVVGVGNDLDADYLKTIASTPGHYFDAADFDDLQAELAKLASCPQ